MQNKTVAILLIVIGIIMLTYTGFNYVTREKVVDIGPIEINKDTNHPVKWSPIIGGVLLLGGVVLLLKDKKS